jgi:hypothetical protein
VSANRFQVDVVSVLALPALSQSSRFPTGISPERLTLDLVPSVLLGRRISLVSLWGNLGW